MSSVLRSILSLDLEMPADVVIKKAKAMGVTQKDAIIRHNIYNLRSDIRRKSGKAAPDETQSAAARQTAAPKPAVPAKPITVPKPVVVKKLAAPVTASPGPDLTGVFANVALVNKVVAIAGGVDQARQVAEAVRACGSLEAFLQHLDLLEGLRVRSTA